MSRVTGIAALLLKLLLMQEVTVDVAVEKVDRFVYLIVHHALSARVEQPVHRVNKLAVLLVYNRVARFEAFGKFISCHFYLSFLCYFLPFAFLALDRINHRNASTITAPIIRHTTAFWTNPAIRKQIKLITATATEYGI